mgnify:CR=1 FL=1
MSKLNWGEELPQGDTSPYVVGFCCDVFCQVHLLDPLRVFIVLPGFSAAGHHQCVAGLLPSSDGPTLSSVPQVSVRQIRVVSAMTLYLIFFRWGPGLRACDVLFGNDVATLQDSGSPLCH